MQGIGPARTVTSTDPGQGAAGDVDRNGDLIDQAGLRRLASAIAPESTIDRSDHLAQVVDAVEWARSRPTLA